MDWLNVRACFKTANLFLKTLSKIDGLSKIYLTYQLHKYVGSVRVQWILSQ